MSESHEDQNHEHNSSKYHTGRKCIDCEKPAGTAWSPHWCWKCNSKRLSEITTSIENIISKMEQPNDPTTKHKAEIGD